MGMYATRTRVSHGHGYEVILKSGVGQRAVYIPATKRLVMLDSPTNGYNVSTHHKPRANNCLVLAISGCKCVPNNIIMVYPDQPTGSAEWKNHWHWLLDNNGTISTNGDPNIVLGVKNGKVTLVHKRDKGSPIAFQALGGDPGAELPRSAPAPTLAYNDGHGVGAPNYFYTSGFGGSHTTIINGRGKLDKISMGTRIIRLPMTMA